jgi:hypothetical protein
VTVAKRLHTLDSTIELAASTSSGRARAVGMLQAILQATLQGAGPVGYCPKVLRGLYLLVACWAFCSWAFCSWILAPGSSFLAFLFLAFRFKLLASSLLALRVLGALDSLDNCRPRNG